VDDVILVIVNAVIFKLGDDGFFAFGNGEDYASISEVVEYVLESRPVAINVYFGRVIRMPMFGCAAGWHTFWLSIEQGLGDAILLASNVEENGSCHHFVI